MTALRWAFIRRDDLLETSLLSVLVLLSLLGLFAQRLCRELRPDDVSVAIRSGPQMTRPLAGTMFLVHVSSGPVTVWRTILTFEVAHRRKVMIRSSA